MVRTVQPVLQDVDRDIEEASALLGELKFEEGEYAEAARLFGPKAAKVKSLPKEDGLALALQFGQRDRIGAARADVDDLAPARLVGVEDAESAVEALVDRRGSGRAAAADGRGEGDESERAEERHGVPARDASPTGLEFRSYARVPGGAIGVRGPALSALRLPCLSCAAAGAIPRAQAARNSHTRR